MKKKPKRPAPPALRQDDVQTLKNISYQVDKEPTPGLYLQLCDGVKGPLDEHNIYEDSEHEPGDWPYYGDGDEGPSFGPLGYVSADVDEVHLILDPDVAEQVNLPIDQGMIFWDGMYYRSWRSYVVPDSTKKGKR